MIALHGSKVALNTTAPTSIVLVGIRVRCIAILCRVRKKRVLLALLVRYGKKRRPFLRAGDSRATITVSDLRP